MTFKWKICQKSGLQYLFLLPIFSEPFFNNASLDTQNPNSAQTAKLT